MYIAFDTCVLRRIRDIFERIHLDLRDILYQFKWIFTDELEIEYKNYQLDDFFEITGIYVPLSESERISFIDKYLLDTFDPADQDLLLLGLRDEIVIVTDDRDLFLQGSALNLQIFFLWTFMFKLVDTKLLTKNNLHKCYKVWEKDRRYSKQTLKFIKRKIDLL